MNETYMILAGSLGMAVALAHGYLGGTRVVAPLQRLNPMSKRVLHAIMFISAVYWFVGGAALVVGTRYFEPRTQSLVAIVVILLYVAGAAGNLWASRGRHFGWVLLLLCAGLAYLGIRQLG